LYSKKESRLLEKLREVGKGRRLLERGESVLSGGGSPEKFSSQTLFPTTTKEGRRGGDIFPDTW